MTDREIMQQALEALQAVKEAPSKDEIQRAWIVSDLLQKRLAQPEPVIDKSAAIRIATALGWVPAGDTSPKRVDEAGKQRQEQIAKEYERGYADAMGWKLQNHLEHLPSRLEVAVKAEREACARLCEELDAMNWADFGEYASGYADEIRKRGKS